VELLLLEEKERGIFRCLGKPGKGLQPGTRIQFNHGSIEGEVLLAEGQERVVRFSGDTLDLFALGEIPLPPYIDRPVMAEDADWYQTVYARQPGAVAAPTAGLHFTEELLDRIREQGVQIAFVTLHVGWGTFKPVSEEELKSGRLHAERFHVPAETAKAIHDTKAHGGRVIAVGTTVIRALESVTQGTTDLFIRPPFEFKVVDALITNFHLPGTSLLLLVAAFAGQEKVMRAYQEAIRERYRFYSYGDAMLIL
jgi:S-adenosylmethionine:tRNA ribosyltransferase-isomerase